MNALTWKVGAILLMVALVVVGGVTGAGWMLAAHNRKLVAAELAAERILTAQYRASIDRQNQAAEKLGEQKLQAEERGAAAQRLAAANGKRFDQALERVVGTTATTCKEAMPTVDSVLEVIR